jgi:hypothetical protein
MMAKRRETRRRKRSERRERTPEELAAAREAQELEAAAGDGVDDDRAVVGERSWTGVAGASLGILIMGMVGVSTLLWPPEDASRLWAIPFAMLAAGFVPALWVTSRASAVRQRVLRGTVVGCLLVAFGSTFVLASPVVAVILMPPTALLAVSAGLIFQGANREPAARRKR